MPRSRNIKPSFFKNEILGQAEPLLGLLFISLWTLADKSGRLEDRPLRIKAETFPYRENIDINGYLTKLQQLEFIDRYIHNGKSIIQVINFDKHQSPHSTEKSSELPCKSIESTITVIQPLNNESACVSSNINVLIPDSLIPDSLIPDSLIADSLRAEKTAPNHKGKQLGKDWQLPKAWGEWALSEDRNLNNDNVRKIAEQFKDHWIANANQRNAKKSDWEAAWRNWVRREYSQNLPKVTQKEAGRKAAMASIFKPEHIRHLMKTEKVVDNEEFKRLAD